MPDQRRPAVDEKMRPAPDTQRRTWHWLQDDVGNLEIMFWGMRDRWAAVGDSYQYTPAELASCGYRYLCPAPQPDPVAGGS